MSKSWSVSSVICVVALCLFLCTPVVHAQTGFAPGVVNHRPSSSERTKGNQIKSAAACQAQKGQWYEEKGYSAFCALPYPDADKVCKSSKDCVGHCIAPITSGSVLQGTCQRDDSPGDCGRPHFENGKVIYFNCD